MLWISQAAALVSLFGGQEVHCFFYVLGGGDQEQFVALVDYLHASWDGELLGLLVVNRDESALGREVAAIDNVLNALAGDLCSVRYIDYKDVRLAAAYGRNSAHLGVLDVHHHLADHNI